MIGILGVKTEVKLDIRERFSIIPKSGKEIKRLLVVLPIYFERISEFIDNLYMKYYISMDQIPPMFKSIENIVLNNIDNIQRFFCYRLRTAGQSGYRQYSAINHFVLMFH